MNTHQSNELNPGIRGWLLGGIAVLLLGAGASPARADGNVVVLKIEDGIGVATAEYVINGIKHAEETSAELIIIEMDTPGGLMASMDDIIKAILGSQVPVATYVTPAGARAASAGTYILMASHIAAMAPTTRLGAATPVSLTGDNMTPSSPTEEPASDDAENDTDSEPQSQPGQAIERKVLNDALAEIRSLAELRGRNADWAEKAVRDAATLTAREALEQNVIEFVADNRADLLEQINGYEVKINSETLTVSTDSVVIEEYEPNWRIKILSAIANPEIVLLLGLIGVYGLMYEGWNPGAIVPGVVGVICLLLAAYALQVLPVNYAGLALIIVGIALMVAEAFAPSFGALGLGGIAAFVFGAILMFDSDIPGFGISLSFVIVTAIFAAATVIWLATYLVRLRRRGAVTGEGSIIGGTATAMESFSATGKVWLEGEAWVARSPVPIQKDQLVTVRAMNGLVLDVEPVKEPNAGAAGYQT